MKRTLTFTWSFISLVLLSFCALVFLFWFTCYFWNYWFFCVNDQYSVSRMFLRKMGSYLFRNSENADLLLSSLKCCSGYSCGCLSWQGNYCNIIIFCEKWVATQCLGTFLAAIFKPWYVIFINLSQEVICQPDEVIESFKSRLYCILNYIVLFENSYTFKCPALHIVTVAIAISD